MQFHPPLEQGRLLRRYKRFLADIELPGGEQLTIHCPNTGSMLNCMREGGQVWFSSSTDLTGQDRAQLSDRNWQVCSSTPAPGATFTVSIKIDFGVVRIDSEECP